jgi:hypothetical protein
MPSTWIQLGLSFMISRELQEWHEKMRRKYELAASRPWLPVELDSEPPSR